MKNLFFTLCCLIFAACGNTNNSRVFNVLDYGAVGDSITDDAVAIQKAIDECNAKGGGQVLFPTGYTFMSGPVELKSNIDIHLEVGATWLANPDESIYNHSAFGENRGEGMMWIYAKDIHDLSISGKGTIDGNGVAFMGKELEDSYELKPLKDSSFDPRPHVLSLFGVNRLSIKDVTIQNGAYWTVHLIGCYDALIDGISLKNKLKIRNGDGIDIDHSKKVRIANCFIESGDDCICLKNRREYEKYGSCHDIVVTNCVMTGRSCAIKIGSENMDSIYNVLFDNCIITASNRGLGIQNRDEGTVTNVQFNNMIVDCKYFSDVWWGKAEPIYVTSYPRAVGNHKDAGWRFPKGATKGKCGEVSEIYFNNVKCYGENGCFIGGDTNDKVNNIYLNNIDITLEKRTDYPGGQYDKRPCVGEGFIQDQAYGVYIESGKNINVSNLNVKVKDSFPAKRFGGDIKRL